ncbi:hypothetical protein [Paenibacillus sp. GXUN7292]|uniref:hypothetical protein n=1 Tax=Paenibacillus sp. GXUN7292 TaxID=3422499 RepID=UPI003D7E8207
MKVNIKIVCAFLILVSLIGCSSNEKSDLHSDRLKPTDKVDIWHSLQYEIITDMSSITLIEPEATANSFMLHFYFRLENRGENTAKDFQAVFNEAIPLTYLSGSLNQGINKGELLRKDNYEITGYYIFKNMESLNEFIEKSSFTLDWIEDNERKSLILRFPSEPTQ